MFDCTCNTQNSLLLDQHNGDDAPQDHPLSTVTTLWVKRHGITVQFPILAKRFLSLNVQKRPGDHPTSYAMDSGGIIPGSKAAGV